MSIPLEKKPAFLRCLAPLGTFVPPSQTSPSKGGRPATLSDSEMVTALTWHVLQGEGVFSHNAAQFNAKPVSDAARSVLDGLTQRSR